MSPRWRWSEAWLRGGPSFPPPICRHRSARESAPGPCGLWAGGKGSGTKASPLPNGRPFPEPAHKGGTIDCRAEIPLGLQDPEPVLCRPQRQVGAAIALLLLSTFSTDTLGNLLPWWKKLWGGIEGPGSWPLSATAQVILGNPTPLSQEPPSVQWQCLAVAEAQARRQVACSALHKQVSWER